MDRREALLVYLREVARDLITRGMVRNHQGWTVTEILRQEPAVVFGSIVKDLSDAGLSVGREIVGGFAQTLLGAVQDMAGDIFGGRRR